MKKILVVLKNVLAFVLLAVAIFFMVLVIFSKKSSDGNFPLFGYEARIVISNSMEKCDETDVSSYEIKDIPIKSIIFIEEVPSNKDKQDEFYKSLRVGDVLTFKYVYAKQETITHRITKIEENSRGGYDIYLEGDNKSSDSSTLSQYIDTSNEDSYNYVIGKVKKVNVPLGYIIYTLKRPVGTICFIIVPCLILIIWEVIRIVNAIKSEKKEENNKKISEKDEEIKRLKEQLDKMQATSNLNEGEENV